MQSLLVSSKKFTATISRKCKWFFPMFAKRVPAMEVSIARKTSKYLQSSISKGSLIENMRTLKHLFPISRISDLTCSSRLAPSINSIRNCFASLSPIVNLKISLKWTRLWKSFPPTLKILSTRTSKRKLKNLYTKAKYITILCSSSQSLTTFLN